MRYSRLNITAGGKYTISVSSLLLMIVVALAFLLHLFIYTASYGAYCATVLFFTALFVVSKPICKVNVPGFFGFWFFSLLVILVNYVFRFHANTVLVDLLVLFSGVLLCICFSRDVRDYERALRVLIVAATFFAVGVLLQRFLPNVHGRILELLPDRLAAAILSRRGNEVIGVRGFTTNTGFSAGYITAGALSIISLKANDARQKKRNIFLLIVLVVAFLFTRKRGHMLFLVLSIILCYLSAVRGAKRVRRIWRVFVVLFVVIVLYFAFADILVEIPMFRAIANTISNLAIGEDITTGRKNLYMWAIQLFREHPLTGIGWGRYRTTVVGVVTAHKTLETHNVYLQLLSETGILGTFFFVGAFLTAWRTTKKLYCKCIETRNQTLLRWRPVLFFSYVYQTYFLLYCLTGNPLYDQFYQILYLFSCSIMVAYYYVLNRIPASERMDTLQITDGQTYPTVFMPKGAAEDGPMKLSRVVPEEPAGEEPKKPMGDASQKPKGNIPQKPPGNIPKRQTAGNGGKRSRKRKGKRGEKRSGGRRS